MSPRKKQYQRAMSDKCYDLITELVLKHGRISRNEIDEIVNQEENSTPEKALKLYEELSEMDVQIVDAAKVAEEADERSRESGDFFTKEEMPEAYSLLLDDSVEMYLKTIGQIPLLTPQEEIYHARRYRDGDLTSKQKLIEANLHLLLPMAKKQLNKGMSYMDLIQEGNGGLIRAIEKFDVDRGFRLKSYAWRWIYQAINRALDNQAKLIRKPVHKVEPIAKLGRASKEIQQREDREACNREVADQNNITKDKLTRSMINKALQTLSTREQRVIRLRYGLDDGHSRTIEEVGKEFNVTPAKIRQIEMKALKKLKLNERAVSDDGIIDEITMF